MTLLDRFRVIATLDESHLLQLLLALSFPFLAVFEQREDLCAFPSWTGANDYATTRLLLVLRLELVKILKVLLSLVSVTVYFLKGGDVGLHNAELAIVMHTLARVT